MKSYQLVLAGLVLVVAASAQAAPIIDVRVDFSDLGAAPAGVGTWNTVATAMTAAATAKDFSGADAQGLNGGIVTYQLTLSGAGWPANAPTEKTGMWADSNTVVTWLDGSGNAAKDAFYSANSGNATLKFTGLDPSVTYNVEVVASDNTSYAASTLVPWTVNGGNQINWSGYTQGFVGGQCLSWNVTPDANGWITIVSTGKASAHNVINAARLYATPEPATLLLVGLGLVGLLRRRQW